MRVDCTELLCENALLVSYLGLVCDFFVNLYKIVGYLCRLCYIKDVPLSPFLGVPQPSGILNDNQQHNVLHY